MTVAEKQFDQKDDFKMMPDKEVVSLIRAGNRKALEYLMNKYERIVRYKARTYFLVGSEREDVIQEGLIGLYKAICDYDANKLSSFRAFADLCITRQIITSIKSATRLKHTPLNSYISIYKPVQEDEPDRILLDMMQCYTATDPQATIINQEKLKHIRLQLNKVLTRLESQVLPLYLEGCTYAEIASELHRHEKSIDNALQRVKRKISRLIETKQLAF